MLKCKGQWSIYVAETKEWIGENVEVKCGTFKNNLSLADVNYALISHIKSYFLIMPICVFFMIYLEMKMLCNPNLPDQSVTGKFNIIKRLYMFL